jgi:hypothetical protein
MRLRASDLEKRYEVFISSTFQDLQGARQEVSQALHLSKNTWFEPVQKLGTY